VRRLHKAGASLSRRRSGYSSQSQNRPRLDESQRPALGAHAGPEQEVLSRRCANVETGRITWVEAPKKNSALFCALLDALIADYPDARTIHVICDNFIIHSSKFTRHHLAELHGKVVLHFLPPYCPDDNRIERVWQDLHANVTRNHQCKTMDVLLSNVRSFLRAYNDREHLNPSLRRVIAVGE